MLWIAFLSSLIQGYCCYRIAEQQKGRDPWFGAALGVCFGIFGILALLLFPPKRQRKQTKQAPRKKASLLGPQDKLWYYLENNDTRVGPISFLALNEAWNQGRIKRSTYVWNEELTDWKLLKEFLKTTSSPSRSQESVPG